LWGYAFLLIGFAYVFGLFVDLTGDSGLYAAISRQMVDLGDWFNLKINGKPYDQKPHLFFWLAGFGIKLFGNTNFAFKLFPFLYGTLGIYFTYRLGKTIFSNEAGKMAALLMGTSQITFFYFFDFHMDSILQSGIVLALWQMSEYLKTKNWLNFIWAFVGVGLAMFSKGPIGAVIPFFAVLFYFISERNYKQIFHFKWFLGIIIVLLIISPTLLYLYNTFGSEGIKFYFITNNFGRITGEYAGSNTDPFFYLHTLLWAFLPWTFLVVFALFAEIKNWFKKGSSNSWGYYLLGSTIVLVLVLSIAKGKAPNYFLIAVAPISVVVGNWVQQISLQSGKLQKRVVFGQLIFVSLIAAMCIFLFWFYSSLNLLIPIILSTACLFIVFYFYRQKNKILSQILLLSVIVVASLNVYLNTQILPHLFSYQGARQVLEIFENEKKEGEILSNFELEEFEMFFYATDTVNEITDWNELYEVMEKSGTWLYTNEIKYNDIIKMGYAIDTIYTIKQHGMNSLDLKFLNPKTCEQSLNSNYLFKTK
jgi:4-amino-4-deoxy-L-arabinose transferase-like glycosyltransferase